MVEQEKEQAIEDVKMIRKVLEKANAYNSTNYPYYIMWGMLFILASAIQQNAYFAGATLDWIYPVIWIAFLLLGFTGSFFLAGKIEKNIPRQVSVYIGKTTGLLWGTGGLAIALVVQLSLFWGVYSAQYILVFITLIIGLTLVSFGVLLHKPAAYLGFLCFPVSVIMIYYPIWQPLILGMLIGGGYFVIGTLDLVKSRRKLHGRL